MFWQRPVFETALEKPFETASGTVFETISPGP